ncbi:MAG: signal recognition particle receptor subunit alpha, partial [Planctomycetota bacterium]|nr:signal recognition particle receptor subunit alpha [Planctomycetota bacterium]
MFERLSDGFGNLFRKLSGKAEISESNVREAMEDVRRALIDADVNQTVVDKFTADVLADAVGTKVTKSLEPGQEMIGIVHRRLVELLGGEPAAETAEPQTSPLASGLPAGVPKIAGLTAPAKASGGALAEPIMRIAPGPTIVMMSGLQGSGKTTTCGKLAAYLRRKNRSVMLAAADLQRPAAVDQLRTVAESVKEA